MAILSKKLCHAASRVFLSRYVMILKQRTITSALKLCNLSCRLTMSENGELSTNTHSSGMFTMEHLRAYLYGHKNVQLIDTTKIQKERIKHLHINKEPKGNSCKFKLMMRDV